MGEHAAEITSRLKEETQLLSRLRARAAEQGARAVLPEGEDERSVAAACALRAMNLAHVVLIGAPGRVRSLLLAQDADPDSFEILDPKENSLSAAVAERLFERRRKRGLSQGESFVLAHEPLHLGAAMVAMGQADAMVAGAVNPTAEVIRAGLYHAGLREGIKVVSGSFLMVPPKGHSLERPLLYADSAVVPAPDEEQLVSIGLSSVLTYERLLGRSPRVACLSFSTHGSAEHPSAAMMARVAAALRERGIEADGELQLDAALVPEVARKKCSGSVVAGQADVLLFPDLNAGNIAYKLTQRLGGFEAIGPLVQGLAFPIFDLSRGASASDIVNTVCLAILCGERS
jgi:phosphate acetyltransferase